MSKKRDLEDVEMCDGDGDGKYAKLQSYDKCDESSSCDASQVQQEHYAEILKKSKMQLETMGSDKSSDDSSFNTALSSSVISLFSDDQSSQDKKNQSQSQSGLPVLSSSQSLNKVSNNKWLSAHDDSPFPVLQLRKPLNKEDVKKIKHREAQKKYKKTIAKNLKELKAYKENSEREYTHVMEQCRSKDILVEELRAVIAVQGEEIRQLKQLMSRQRAY